MTQRAIWSKRAACRDAEDPGGFYEIEDAADEERPEDPDRIATALSYCGICPIVDTCLANAKAKKEYGIWGDQTAEERKRVYPPVRLRRQAEREQKREEKLRSSYGD